MGEPTDPISGPPKSNTSRPKSIHQQRGCVYQAFRKLNTKCEIYNGPWNPPDSISSVKTNQKDWKAGLNQLQSHNLPLLRQQISTLPKLLVPSELRKDDDGSKLQRITDIQSELDQNLDQIISFTSAVRTRSIFSSAQTDDNHRKEFKEFIRHGLCSRIKYLNDELCSIFNCCSGTIRELKKPVSPSNRVRRLNRRRRMIHDITAAKKSINQLTKWLTNHEITNIQEKWKKDIPYFNHKLTRLKKLINQTIDYPEVEDEDENKNKNEDEDDGVDDGDEAGADGDGDEDDGDGDESENQIDELFSGHNEAVISLAQSAIAVIKLSRLFFKRMSKIGLNQAPLKPFTDMNSYQLETLTDSPSWISYNICLFVSIVTDVNETDEAETAETLTQSVQKIVHRVDSIILLLFVYVFPLLPSPNHARNYLVTWNNLFLTATQNCIRAAQFLKTLSSSSSLVDPLDDTFSDL
ncbi:hypothetical protein PCANC_25198 [Puccinia coronata f. sp. avenae]|uniref:Uncharacterized protein n=1 Tax=Puccinia coronata f. sp. avenae TaxID=200324 RepID=A0A2N5TA54_9BASI|nr:hypothetical protein PCANC_25198 [Puccinia coronata f. sp. avenae]